MKTMQIILAIIVVIAVVVEAIISSLRDIKEFDKRDSVTNFIIGCFSVFLSLSLKGITLAILMQVRQFAVFQLPFNFLSGVALFLLCDLQYYWFHRLGHVSRFFWASHAIHHSSHSYNYTVALRLPFTNGVYRFLIFAPLCLLGFPPGMIFLTDALINYYTFFTHTERIGKLGWLEKFLNTPSHHRVHHSSNPQYIDKNFGGALIIWDKLFGTFIEEEEQPRYGLTKSFLSYNPVKIVLDEWQEMINDLKSANGFIDVIKIVFGYPGWKPEKKAVAHLLIAHSESKNLLNTAFLNRAKPVALKIAYVAIVSFGLVLFTSFAPKDSYNWEQKKNENGIAVYTKYTEGSSLKQVRVVNKVKSSLSGIVALLLDTKHYPDWVEGCHEARTLKVINDHEMYNYQVTDLPWPITDRDVVADFKIEQDATTGVVRFTKTAVPQFIPTNEGLVRVQNLNCVYTLTPISDDNVLIEMELNVDPGGSIPTWLINANIVAAPFKSTTQMIKRLPQYQSASYSFIKESL